MFVKTQLLLATALEAAGSSKLCAVPAGRHRWPLCQAQCSLQEPSRLSLATVGPAAGNCDLIEITE